MSEYSTYNLANTNIRTLLDQIYHDSSNPGGFSTFGKLYEKAHKINPIINKQDVKVYLQTQQSHTRFGLVPKRFIKKPVDVVRPGHLIGADLADLTDSYRKMNDNYRYLLFIIDCFSRKLWVIPLEDKRGKTIATKFDLFFKLSPYKYNLLWVDEGGEFFSKHTKKVTLKHDVKIYHVFNRRFKCSYAERVIQTIKRKLFKTLAHFNTMKFVHHLSNIVTGYNNTPHRGLGGLTPNTVHNITNPQTLDDLAKWQHTRKLRNYGSSISRATSRINLSQRDILSEGTLVRLLCNESEGVFNKSYLPIYSHEIFVIDKVELLKPTIYHLKDLMDEPIRGVVYRAEIKQTSLPDYFPIEKILKTRTKAGKKQHFVKYIGWPEKFSSWISEADVHFQ